MRRCANRRGCAEGETPFVSYDGLYEWSVCWNRTEERERERERG